LSAPQRMCVACRRSGDRTDLVRLQAQHDRVLVDAPRAAGRGAYLCPTVECLDLAMRKRVFKRALRRDVVVNDEFRGRFLDACALRRGGELNGTQETGR
jgi:uncharacterized protein